MALFASVESRVDGVNSHVSVFVTRRLNSCEADGQLCRRASETPYPNQTGIRSMICIQRKTLAETIMMHVSFLPETGGCMI